MIRRIVEAIAARMPPPRVIMDRLGVEPYLSRYYITGKPTMPDGSYPFDESGAVRRGSEPAPGIGVFLHRFHKSDESEELHNHPWEWAISLVLVGGYSEQRKDRITGRVRRRMVGPFRLNLLTADDFHRVDLVEKDAWTLFIVGPKHGNSWGFLDWKTGAFEGWREYIARVRGKHQAGR